MKKFLAVTGAIIVVILVAAGSFFGVYVYPVFKQMKPMTTIPYDKQLTIVLGGVGNSGILVSDSLVLVVDTKMDDGAKQFYGQVKQLAGNKPIVVVNTHIHSDHTQGDSYYKGQAIIAGGNYDKAAWIADNGDKALPTVWVKDSLVFKVGDETVTVLNIPFAAHTQSDVVVYLHNRQLIFAGDLVLNKKMPAIFSKYNASPAGYLKAFDLMEQRFDIKTVVPGHGPIGGVELINMYRQFFKDMQTAANDGPDKRDLIQKYEHWTQIPFLMSPESTIAAIRKEKK